MAQCIDRLLKGVMVASLPFEQGTRTPFIFNLRATVNLEVAISLTLLVRADEVIE